VSRGKALSHWAPAIAIAALAFGTLASLINRHPMPDFDTDALLEQAAEGSYHFTWAHAGDTAHPFGYVFQRLYMGAFGADAPTAWTWLLCVMLLAVFATLLAVAIWRGTGRFGFLAAAALIGISPAILANASRANEKFIGDALLVGAATLAMVYLSRDTTRSRWLIPLTIVAVLNALHHFQGYLILAGGVGLVCLVGLRAGAAHIPLRRIAAVLAATVALPGLIIVVLQVTGSTDSVAYQEKYPSVFNPQYFDDLGSWAYDYLKYASRWLAGLSDTTGYFETGGDPPGGGDRAVFGLLALAVATGLVIRSRDALVVGLFATAVALSFLYEPGNSERWNSIVMAVALAFVARKATWAPTATSSRAGRRPRRGRRDTRRGDLAPAGSRRM
jgi:uncharacterized membrane protein